MKRGFLAKKRSPDEQQLSVKDVEELIRKWLLEEGYDVKKLNDPKTHFSYRFNRNGRPPNFVVLQSKSKGDSITMFHNISWGKRGNELTKLSEKKRNEVLTKIRVSLATIRCNFSFSPDDPKGMPEGISLMRTLYYDGLSKNSFFEMLNIVSGGGVLVSQALFQALGISPIQKTSQPDYVE